MGGNGHSRGPVFNDITNGIVNTNNNTNNNDILPAVGKFEKFEIDEKCTFPMKSVGEIVIWDEKDQGGYMIDNNGAWAKIEGRQWFGSNIFKNCSKTPLAKR